MNWFRENRFMGAFLTGLALCLSGCIWFLLGAKGEWNEASSRFDQIAAELNRLERVAPYPSEENVRKMRACVDDYAITLARFKEALQTCVLPAPRTAPNEFQSQLRLAMTGVAEKARANRVRLPDKFYLGFDEFASALPSEAAAPLLGQELAQIEWLLHTLIEARVDALTSFRRKPLPEEHGAMPALPASAPASGKPGAAVLAGPKLLERNVVETTFVSTPTAARRVLNQIAGTNRQFCIIRLWHVRNEKDKGPPREVAEDGAAVLPSGPPSAPAGSAEAKPSPPATLHFIVGNERIETSARIELLRFTFQ
jgi:hypothetical protein